MYVFAQIKVLAPGPGVCRICAARHDPDEPHDRDSLYYQNRFRRRHKRFPTWADALSHCDETTRSAWREALIKRGVSSEEFGGDGT